MPSKIEKYSGKQLHIRAEKALLVVGKLVSSLLIKAFIFTLIFPGTALAFTPDNHLFERDEDLKNRAVVGIEAFGSSPRTINRGSEFTVAATAYTSSVNETDGTPNLTASGKRTRRSVIAANFLPLGTKVKISGSIYVVGDRMNARYNGQRIIDFWFPTKEGAKKFGLRTVEIQVISVPTK